MKREKLAISAIFWVALSFVAEACGDTREDAENSVESEGCEHRENGPFETAMAFKDAANVTTAIDLAHHDVAVTLADLGGGNYGGFVSFAVDEFGEYVIYLDRDVPITLRDDQGAVATIEQSVTRIEECPEVIAAYHVFDFDVGTYTLEFGASSEATIHVVLAPTSDEHGYDH